MTPLEILQTLRGARGLPDYLDGLISALNVAPARYALALASSQGFNVLEHADPAQAAAVEQTLMGLDGLRRHDPSPDLLRVQEAFGDHFEGGRVAALVDLARVGAPTQGHAVQLALDWLGYDFTSPALLGRLEAWACDRGIPPALIEGLRADHGPLRSQRHEVLERLEALVNGGHVDQGYIDGLANGLGGAPSSWILALAGRRAGRRPGVSRSTRGWLMREFGRLDFPTGDAPPDIAALEAAFAGHCEGARVAALADLARVGAPMSGRAVVRAFGWLTFSFTQGPLHARLAAWAEAQGVPAPLLQARREDHVAELRRTGQVMPEASARRSDDGP